MENLKGRKWSEVKGRNGTEQVACGSNIWYRSTSRRQNITVFQKKESEINNYNFQSQIKIERSGAKYWEKFGKIQLKQDIWL